MSAKRILKKLARSARVSLAILTAVPFALGGTLANAAPPDQGHEKQHNQAQSPSSTSSCSSARIAPSIMSSPPTFPGTANPLAICYRREL